MIVTEPNEFAIGPVPSSGPHLSPGPLPRAEMLDHDNEDEDLDDFDEEDFDDDFDDDFEDEAEDEYEFDEDDEFGDDFDDDNEDDIDDFDGEE